MLSRNIFANCDYKQLEVRVAAWLSRDPALLEACRGDIHTVVSNQVFGRIISAARACKDISELERYMKTQSILSDLYSDHMREPYTELDKLVTELVKRLRDQAKKVIFGVMYGREAYSLATGPLKCTQQDAQKFIDNLFIGFPLLYKYLEEQKAIITKNQWLDTYFGRRRRFPYMNEEFERRVLKQTINMPIQSTANDICFLSFVKIAPELRANDYGRVKFLVHDAIAFSLRKRTARPALQLIKYHMENTIRPVDVDIVFQVDQEVGPSYGELSKVTEEQLQAWEQNAT